jgi:predicted dienelactone hydrolase
MILQHIRTMSRSIVVIVLSIYAMISTCQAQARFSIGAKQLIPRNPPVATAISLGSYSIGVRRETFPFDNRQLNVSWWYPATIPSVATGYISGGGISGKAVTDAPLNRAGGLYPLIVFSPGLGAHDDAYYFYCQNLASNGYIVVSINHLDATEVSIGANLAAMAQAAFDMLNNQSSNTVGLLFSKWFRSTHFALTYRPQEIGFILDKAIAAATDASSFFYRAMDTNNIGMSGHSLGGFYSLLKGGGMAITCNEPLTADESNTANLILTSVNICAWPEAKALATPTALHDSRIKATIALAAPFFNSKRISRDAAAITTPMMVLSGNDPRYESTLAPQRQAYEAAKGPKYKVEINATDHLLISDAYHFNGELAAMVPAEDKANFEQKAEVYMVYSAAFFDVYLKGNTSRKEVLHRPSSTFVASLEHSD